MELGLLDFYVYLLVKLDRTNLQTYKPTNLQKSGILLLSSRKFEKRAYQLENISNFRYYKLIGPELMNKLYRYFLWDFVLMGYSKLDNPNFPYLDFDQDIEKEFGELIATNVDIVTEEPGTQPTIDPTVKI